VAQLFNFPVPAGTNQPVVADGYWVMFKPLTPGVHFVHAKGVEAHGFTVEETYTLIVVGSH
jgi:predicted RNase H-like HicB family nuclease